MLWPFYLKTWMHRVRALEEKNLQKEEIWDAVVVEATEKKKKEEKKKDQKLGESPISSEKMPKSGAENH